MEAIERMMDGEGADANAQEGEAPRLGLVQHGAAWVKGTLPAETEWWSKVAATSQRFEGAPYDAEPESVRRYLAGEPWLWSGKRVVFLCDIHADTDAWFTSLVASGTVEKIGEGDDDFVLLDAGKSAEFIVGGDCFDKGPNNLRLLRAIGALRAKGATVRLLAGNHDLRTLVGLQYLGRKEPRFAHLFVRMGKKSVPLFQEIWSMYLEGRVRQSDYPSDDELAKLLLPDESWYSEFPVAVGDQIPRKKLLKELVRIREKVMEMTAKSREVGMPLWQIYAAALKGREIFAPHGEFGWFFSTMTLAVRHGGCLFVHAGLADGSARLLKDEGVAGLNGAFRRLLEQDLFELYHGPLGNTFRTKYRDIDFPLTEEGVENIHAAGVRAIVHGHRNIHYGQRLVMRRGILNFECDASVDINTRQVEGMTGFGGAVTVFEPDGRVWASSTDHPLVKVFDPSRHTALTLDPSAIE